MGATEATIDDMGAMTATSMHTSALHCAACGHCSRFAWLQLAGVVRCAACRRELTVGERPLPIDGAGLEELLGARVPVVVDFWSARYRGVGRMRSQLDAVAARAAGRYLTVEIDADLHPHVATRLGIASLPTVAVFADGHELARDSDDRTTAPLGALELVELVDRALASRLPRMSMLRRPA